MSELGTCDKKQYEHYGPHEQQFDFGQSLPPFGCENWKRVPPVNESLRAALLSARAFADVFILAMDDELKGSSSDKRIEASDNLYAALENIETLEELMR